MVFDIAPPNDACQREVQFITTGKGEIRRFSLIKTKVHERWWTVPSVLLSMVDYSNGPICPIRCPTFYTNTPCFITYWMET